MLSIVSFKIITNYPELNERLKIFRCTEDKIEDVINKYLETTGAIEDFQILRIEIISAHKVPFQAVKAK